MKNDSKKMILSMNTVRAAWAMCVSVVVVNALILVAVLPYIERSLGLYIPAKTGGKTFYINQPEFLTISLISLVVLSALLLQAHILHKRKKFDMSYLSASMVFTTGSIYLATILGNVFDELWGGAWSIMGIVIGLLIGIILTTVAHTRTSKTLNKV